MRTSKDVTFMYYSSFTAVYPLSSKKIKPKLFWECIVVLLVLTVISLFSLQIFREARRVAPSVIYLPHLDSLWSTTTDTLKATFLSLVNDLPPGLPLLLFAICDSPVSKIPPDLAVLFSVSCEQVRCVVDRMMLL